ncbi:MAG TPA: FAD-binding protein [Acidobacteriota bacterium]|nr:FAD-binding protein [Acidobacteriota bacterium]
MSLRKLEELVPGRVHTDEETVQMVTSDFGRLVRKTPAVVVAPETAEEVQKTIQFANEEGWSVGTRGEAHSQSGQSLNEGGILLDLSNLKQIGPVEDGFLWAEGGASWKDLVETTAERGYTPPVLTNNLNVTIGGTLSMAGLGVASHRYGTQADQVEELEVVTGDGHLVRCSENENRELFDCTRSGLGQFSVITRVRLRLRRFAPRVRTFYLLYDDMDALIKDQELVMEEDRFDYIEGWCSPCIQGLRQMGETEVPFAEWFYPVQLSKEYEDSPPDQELLSGLHFYRSVHRVDRDYLDFARRVEPVFQLWRQSGAWDLAHPWMELILPWKRAGEYIDGVLKNLPPNLVAGGHILLWPCRGTASKVPMFMRPQGEYVMGFGILPAVPRQLLPMTLALLNRASELGMQIGGKRYLSGWVEFDHSKWKAHFGNQWETVLQCKKFYDPKSLLNPGFIHYYPSDRS